MGRVKIDKIDGGLNTGEETGIQDNQLAVAENAYYDNRKRLSIRLGQDPFGNEIAGADGIKNLYSTRFTDGTRILLCAAGTNMYRYDESDGSWDVIKSGLTSGLKYSFLTYKDVINWTNGTDNFMSYDGTTVSEHASVPKGKYMVLENDIAYMGGIATDPSLLVYTDANPVSLAADEFQNEVEINQDEGFIKGIGMLGAFPVVGKSKGNGLYMVNIGANPISINPVDFDGDLAGGYSMVNVENDLLFVSTAGIYSLAQRSGSSGVYRAYPWSSPIDEAFKRLGDKTFAAAKYFKRTNNVYFCFDSGSGRNDTTFVLSVLASVPGQYKYVWTEYKNWAFNDFAVWEDEDGVEHFLAAPSYGGQIMEVEKKDCYADNGLAIAFKARTKTFDLEEPKLMKIWEHPDLTFLISEQEVVTITINADGVETEHVVYGSDYATGEASETHELGTSEIGVYPLGGGGIEIDGLVYYVATVTVPVIKYARRLSIQVETSSVNSGVKFIKAAMDVVAMDSSIFPTGNYST